MITAQVVLINELGLILGVSRKDNHIDKLTISEKVKIYALERGYTLYDMDKDKKITEVGKCVLKDLRKEKNWLGKSQYTLYLRGVSEETCDIDTKFIDGIEAIGARYGVKVSVPHYYYYCK